MADKDFDFSDLPEVQAENAAVVEAAGVPTAPLSEISVPELDEQELQDLGTELELERKYGDSPITTLVETAVGEATFGLSDRIAQAAGITTQEAQKERAERNPGASMLGTATGIVAPALASGGTSLAAKGVSAGARAISKAALAAEKAAAKAIVKATAAAGGKQVAQSVLKKSILKAAGQATEGALYGAGHLAREDAIGTADFNAENLLSAVGTGALYGGAIGAALPSIGGALGTASATAKKLFGKGLSKYADPVKAAEELTGFNAAKQAKLRSSKSGKQILEDLPEWYKNEVKIGAMDDAEAVISKVQQVKASAADEISNVLKEADSVAAAKLGSRATSPEMRAILLNKVRVELEEKFLEPIRGDKVFQAEARQVQNLLDDLNRYTYQKKPLTSTELIKLKRKMDDIVGRAYERAPGAKRTRLEKAAFEARQLLNDASHTWLTHIDSSLAARLKQANRNYQMASTVELPLLRKSVKDTQFLGFRDALYGLGGAVLGDAGTGALILGGKKILESDLRRRLVILGGLEKAQVKVASEITDSVKQFLGKGSNPARLASMSALVNSSIAQKREEGKKPEAPKNRKEAYKNATVNLAHLVTNSDELMQRGVKAGAALSHAAPETAAVIGTKAINGINFLLSKIPKRPYETIFPSGKQRDYDPSSLELARFERYLQVVDSPLTVLQELKQGTLTREHVEALKTVYPNLYSRIQQQVLQELQRVNEEDIPYAKRVQTSILLDIPADDSLLGKNIAALQANFTRKEQQDQAAGAPMVKPTASGTQNVDTASRSGSDTTAFLQRRNSGE